MDILCNFFACLSKKDKDLSGNSVECIQSPHSNRISNIMGQLVEIHEDVSDIVDDAKNMDSLSDVKNIITDVKDVVLDTKDTVENSKDLVCLLYTSPSPRD